MKVLIKTEAGPGIGYGHFTRCIALCQAFREQNIVPQLWVKGSIQTEKISEDFSAFRFEHNQDLPIFNSNEKPDILIIDSYLDTESDYHDFSKKSRLCVFLDDTGRLKYPQGIILNGTIDCSHLKYPHERFSPLSGAQYILLRSVFWDIYPQEIRSSVSKVLITFGGDDRQNLTPKVLEKLNKLFPTLKKSVIVTDAFNNLKEIETVANDNTDLIWSPNARKILEQFLSSDIAVSAGGQTVNELTRTGTPTIIIAVAENQLPASTGWMKMGASRFIGTWRDPSLFNKLEEELRQLQSYETRVALSHQGQMLSDGQGARRAVKKIIEAANLA